MASDQKRHRQDQHAPDEQHPTLAATVADQDASHGANSHRQDHHDPQDRQEHDARTLHALQELTDTALSHLSLEALLPELLERLRTVMRVDNVAILVLDEEAQELEVSAASGPEEEVVGRVRIPVGVGFAGRIAATRAPLGVEDLSAYPVSNPLVRNRLRSALGVPLMAADRVLGVVHIGTTTPHTFTPGEQALLEQAADRIARAIERAQLFQSERDIRLVLQRQASLINLSFEPIFAWSTEGGIVEWNAGAEQLYGYTRAEALGRISHDLLRTAHPIPLDALLTALDRDGQWTGELRHTTRDGREVVVESRQQRIDLGGQRLILETNRDVTERRRLERRTREALDALLAMAETLVFEDVAAATGDYADVTGPAAAGAQPIARRLAELTRGLMGCSRVSISALEGEEMASHPIAVAGLTAAQEAQWWEEQRALTGRRLRESMLPPELERLLAGETATFDLTRPPYEYPNPYGVTAILGAPMQAQGRLIGLLALDYQSVGDEPHVFTDEESRIALAVARLGAVVLERDRLLREREAARAEALALTAANRRMDEFLGIAGHELRTPLTTVKANLQLAERRARQMFEAESRDSSGEGSGHARQGSASLEQLVRLLDRSTASVDRQERLIQDLLDVSRIAAGRLEYRLGRYDLTALVSETVDEQRATAPRRRITMEAPAEPIEVEVDADRIGQVVTNYLTNALKYSEADQPVAVSVRQQGEVVRVEVRDRGPGLAPEQQRHLFERFYRVEGVEVVSGSGVGLGLGLYISKTIVEQHGGAVGVDSAPGQGSAFWFTLPLT